MLYIVIGLLKLKLENTLFGFFLSKTKSKASFKLLSYFAHFDLKIKMFIFTNIVQFDSLNYCNWRSMFIVP